MGVKKKSDPQLSNLLSHGLRDLLGPESVSDDPAMRDRYAVATSSHGTEPLAITWPTTTEQVQRIVELAGEHGVGVYPIARGKNWGYGDACAPTDGQIIIDLSRMNRIVELNRDLCYVVLEPGVSQGQLHEYLQQHSPELWMDATGAGLDASILGNTLDRGFGHTRYGDHFLTACGMEVVLADGRVLNTGFGHFPNAKAGRVYRYGIGPFIDGLFAQSNFGIVTRLGLWLMPRPEAFCTFFFYSDRDDQLGEMIDRLAPLRMQGLLQSTIHIGNDLRVYSARTRYPFDRTDGETPLPADVRAAMRREHGIGAWNGGGALYGTRGMVKSIQRELRKALRGFHLHFVNDRTLALADFAHRAVGWTRLGRQIGEILEVLRPTYGLMKGVPSDEPLRGAAWRVRDPDPGHPEDPRDNHTGLLWASPVLPNQGGAAHELLELVEPIYEKHGFEALVTFTMITERAMIAVTNVTFDRREPEETGRAHACYDELFSRLIESGFIPYRTGPDGFAKLHQHDSVYWDVLGRIKQTLDPENIIAPGRYVWPK
jgi:4-cresol dehydrogenase (hydroxylating)